MPDYQKSKIYKLWSPSTGLTYFGSTTQSLSQRLGGHIRDTRRGGKYLCSSIEIINCGDYKIELVEEYPCNNKSQLEKKEGEYIRNNECINKIVAGRTKNEWRQDNADKIKATYKKYYEANVDKLKEQSKKYKEANVDKIKEKNKKYNEANVDKIKQYYKDNIDRLKEQAKKYREDNPDKIKERRRKYYEAKKCMALEVV